MQNTLGSSRSRHSTGIKTAIAGVMTGAIAMTVLTADPVQAASLAPGSFRLIGHAEITDPSGPSFDLSFKNTDPAGGAGFLDIDTTPLSLQGVFASLTAGTGGAKVKTLTLDKFFVPGVYTSGAVNGFISNIFLGGQELFVDLDPLVFTGLATSPTQFSLSSSFQGRVRDAGGNVFALGTIGALQLGGNEANVQVATQVPTPALLPGLIGMGITMFRRRKTQRNSQRLMQA
jgi:hypothetical protein